MATKNGTIKKSKLTDYENIRRSGLVAIKLEKGDELIWAKLTSGEDDILLVSHDGKSIRFKESEVRPTGRDTMGVRGILFKGADSVVSVDVINEETKKADFLTVMEKGIGKKTAIKDFPRQKRAGRLRERHIHFPQGSSRQAADCLGSETRPRHQRRYPHAIYG